MNRPIEDRDAWRKQALAEEREANPDDRLELAYVERANSLRVRPASFFLAQLEKKLQSVERSLDLDSAIRYVMPRLELDQLEPVPASLLRRPWKKDPREGLAIEDRQLGSLTPAGGSGGLSAATSDGGDLFMTLCACEEADTAEDFLWRDTRSGRAGAGCNHCRGVRRVW